MHVESIFIHPIKSGAALSVDQARVEPRGLEFDRRWMVVDEDGRFLTGREFPRLTLVNCQPVDTILQCHAPGMSVLEAAIPGDDSEVIEVCVWKDEVLARVVSQAADAWFSRFLQRPVRLVYQPPELTRSIAGRPGAQSDDIVSFADGFPLLLLGTGSLHDLNARLDQTVSARQFRPNLLISAQAPFAEDAWSRIRIGGVELDGFSPCTRCVFTTVDPDTGARSQSGEPFRTLSGYRRSKNPRGVIFGVNAIARSEGVIRVGDPVAIL